MEIPVNTDTSHQEIVDKAVAYVLEKLKEQGWARLDNGDYSRNTAMEVTRMFMDKGYYASETWNRRTGGGSFWHKFEIGTTPREEFHYRLSDTTILR